MNSMQINCFLEAARSLNFTFAASTLYITQSTLSKNIIALEQELDVQLFFRDRRGIRLTPGGSLLYEYLNKLSDLMPQWIQQAQLANQGLSATLKVGHLSIQHINADCAAHIAAFERKYQNIHISIQYENFKSLMDKLRHGEIDIAISTTFEVDQEPDLTHQEIVRVKNLLVIPDAYPLKRPELRDARNPSLADFAQETFLTLSEQESSYITPLILHSCAQAGFVPQLVEAPTFETLLLWLELGRGLFALNEENMIYRSGRVRMLELPEFPPITLSAAWLKQPSNPCVSLLVGELPKLGDSHTP